MSAMAGEPLAGSDFVDGGLFVDHMAEVFPRLHYSKKEIARAGKTLGGEIPWSPDDTDAAAQIFRIAYDWRDSHILPMRRIRYELGGKIRRLKAHAVTAARTKRMKSIRKKLTKSSITLAQIQDLVGCRAILDSMAEVRALVSVYQGGGSAHILRGESPYIEQPRASGYRSHHLVLTFQGDESEETYSGRRVELQIRTRLQHTWATAVEAVGLVKKQDLKGGRG